MGQVCQKGKASLYLSPPIDGEKYILGHPDCLLEPLASRPVIILGNVYVASLMPKVHMVRPIAIRGLVREMTI